VGISSGFFRAPSAHVKSAHMTTTAPPEIKVKKKLELVFKVEPPYRVMIHNDDVTPMDFVVDVLMQIFNLSFEDSEAVMYSAHINGRALVVVCPEPIARDLVKKARAAASGAKFPLRFSVMPDE
jgi:ATP-dependent Clp protease adaptor protein ClpS